MSVVQIDNLKVKYGFRTAVEGLSLEVEAGKSLGLLGVNGAGKTSTIRALMGMLRPSGGSVKVLGNRPGIPSVLSKIGFAPEEASPPDFLDGEEYLSFIAAYRVARTGRAKAVKAALADFDLDGKKKIKEYSKGMRRRLLLAQSMLGHPKLLILDEPLNGLDPLVIIRLRERLEEYCKQGGTLLYSSHILNEVEKTCTDIAIIHDGRLQLKASIKEVLKKFDSVEDAFAKSVGVEKK